jgi:hypothetical protein
MEDLLEVGFKPFYADVGWDNHLLRATLTIGTEAKDLPPLL